MTQLFSYVIVLVFAVIGIAAIRDGAWITGSVMLIIAIIMFLITLRR